ncbi:hypothetical protein VZT92_011584 [Zoarces viviparus]|uniref:Uncharacterized protein n=1 Tax=Zoarces viviparus TaxID=48416 RepID=A0AAW1F6B7_ZOAVI
MKGKERLQKIYFILKAKQWFAARRLYRTGNLHPSEVPQQSDTQQGIVSNRQGWASRAAPTSGAVLGGERNWNAWSDSQKNPPPPFTSIIITFRDPSPALTPLLALHDALSGA